MLVLERLREEYDAVVENPGAARRIWRMVKMCVRKLVSVLTIPEHIRVRYHGERLRIDSEPIQEAMIGVTYRFKTGNSSMNCTRVWKFQSGSEFLMVDTKSTVKNYF